VWRAIPAGLGYSSTLWRIQSGQLRRERVFRATALISAREQAHAVCADL
jgi:hypothetical protein